MTEYISQEELIHIRRTALIHLEAHGRRFRSKKTGEDYFVRDVVFIEKDCVPAYAYHRILPDGEQVTFIRPVSEFHTRFERIPK